MVKTLAARLFGISIALAVTSARADVPAATIEPPHELRTSSFDARAWPDDHGGTGLRAAGISLVTFGSAHMALGFRF